MSTSQYYDEGYEAAEAGMPWSMNPHAEGTAAGVEWAAGWEMYHYDRGLDE